MTGEDVLRRLPATFTYSEAREAGLSERRLYKLRDDGVVEVVGRGLFRRTDTSGLIDVDLLGIARRAPLATLCLTSALARHGLTDEIPSAIDVALPRGTYRPAVQAPVAWHLFDAGTFEIGRNTLPLDEQTSIGIYDVPRSIIDAARLRHREGSELVYGALRRWLSLPGSSPSELLAMARHFPLSERTLREAMEILL
ncbi:transcriptional regulator [Actinoplanes ianthinogenes]|uniref:Transcriptional regulator n=1 Tax=Actinoplanes ianthinogenes TaxID=122358 RepID=A0ABN6CCM2_9ACTN|nr:transcriptional regulator [Actinoplanes ianthinogenes]GGQ93069.1 transcriptional regulator [Actinoplanes ianthinogenes]